jgi:hypothetical protein
MYVANSTSKMAASRPADSHHTHTLPPHDGLLMFKTCKGMTIQYTVDKQCIELVITHINHDTWSTQQKKYMCIYMYIYSYYFILYHSNEHHYKGCHKCKAHSNICLIFYDLVAS